MRKELLMLGAAIAALAGCTRTEVVEVAENRLIRFDRFVNNSTKAVEEITTATLQEYYVFGEFGDAEGTYGNKIFDNELQTTSYYWVADKYYSFGAYADGNNGKIDNASFAANEGKLTFTDYTPDDKKDLVAAVAKVQCGNDPAAQSAVPLDFKHLLSQVKFTFNTTDAESYTLAITDLTLHAAKTGTATYDEAGIKWDATYNNTDTYGYDDVADVSDASYEAQSKLVIPQGNTGGLKVTFTATISGNGITAVSNNFEATLAYAGGTEGTEANTWTPGFRYNYTATINYDTIDPDVENRKIEFTPTVEEWKDAAGSATTPAGQQGA